MGGQKTAVEMKGKLMSAPHVDSSSAYVKEKLCYFVWFLLCILGAVLLIMHLLGITFLALLTGKKVSFYFNQYSQPIETKEFETWPSLLTLFKKDPYPCRILPWHIVICGLAIGSWMWPTMTSELLKWIIFVSSGLLLSTVSSIYLHKAAAHFGWPLITDEEFDTGDGMPC